MMPLRTSSGVSEEVALGMRRDASNGERSPRSSGGRPCTFVGSSGTWGGRLRLGDSCQRDAARQQRSAREQLGSEQLGSNLGHRAQGPVPHTSHPSLPSYHSKQPSGSLVKTRASKSSRCPAGHNIHFAHFDEFMPILRQFLAQPVAVA